jgi:hypothetical protein
MRRAEREIVGDAGIREILEAAPVLYLAIRDDPAPYVIPVCFGFEKGTIYFHSAVAGTKVDLLRADPRVGFSAHAGFEVKAGRAACDFAARALSVTGTGVARIVEEEKERIRGLDLIMRHYSSPAPSYSPSTLARTLVIAVDIRAIRGKRIG